VIIRRPQFVIFSAFTVSFCTGLTLVTVPLLAKDRLDVSPLLLGCYGFFPAFLYVVGALVAGRLSERLGRGRVMAFGLGGFALGSGLCVFMQRPALLVVPYALAGAAVAFYWPVIEAAMSDGQTARQTKRGTGLFNTAWMFGLVLGPIASGLLYSIHHSLALCAAVGLTAVVLAVLAAPRTLEIVPWRDTAGDDEDADRHVPAQERALFVVLGLLANASTFLMIGSFRTLLPEYAVETGVTGWRYGMLQAAITIGMLASNAILVFWRRWHYSLGFLAGAQAVTIVLLVAFVRVDSLAVLTAIALLIGFPAGVTYFSSIYYGLELSERKGAHSGNHEAIVGTGLAIGPLVGGWAIGATGHSRANFAMCAGLIALSIAAQVAIAVAWRRRAARRP